MKVAFVELPVFQGILPLASGYMQASASTDSAIAREVEFETCSIPVTQTYEAIHDAVDRTGADLFAFSCYVWNMGLVRSLLRDLRSKYPRSRFLLGGPQVMHKAERYLDPSQENVFLCNGEGELTFRGFLSELLKSSPRFGDVCGLSYCEDGQLITTEDQPRISSLDQVPSPFLEGVFPPNKYVWALIETNRGCPFRCSYCYWGAATGKKVHKYPEDRVKAELTWLTRNGAYYIFIADANFGMLKRDIELAHHIAALKRETGLPGAIYFSSSKNTPDRVSEVVDIFHEAGLITTQPISLQSLSERALDAVQRKNIKTEAYMQLQRDLNEKSVSSFLEMIWPLPGETLQSYKEGLSRLCELEADSFMLYPLLLINNVGMAEQADELGFSVIDDPSTFSEAEIVVGTNDVSHEEYLEGLRFGYHLSSLYTGRAMWCVGRYLQTEGICPFLELFSQFAEFCKENGGNPYCSYIEDTLAASEQYKFHSMGGIIHISMHSERDRFLELLCSFARSRDWWQDEQARFLFECDLVNRPYIYSNTRIDDLDHAVETIELVETVERRRIVRLPEGGLKRLRGLVSFEAGGTPRSASVEVDYRRTQLPFMPGKSFEDNLAYCQDILHKIRSILPTWRPATSSGIAATAGRSMGSHGRVSHARPRR